MEVKDKMRIHRIGLTIKNSEEKIKNYKSKLGSEKDSAKRKILVLKKEIEQLRVQMKLREGKLITLKK